MDFKALSGADRYEWMESVLRRFTHLGLPRRDKGLIRRYIGRMAGYSRSQVCRLVARYRREGRLPANC
jgi:hypothetical protein